MLCLDFLPNTPAEALATSSFSLWLEGRFPYISPSGPLSRQVVVHCARAVHCYSSGRCYTCLGSRLTLYIMGCSYVAFLVQAVHNSSSLRPCALMYYLRRWSVPQLPHELEIYLLPHKRGHTHTYVYIYIYIYIYIYNARWSRVSATALASW